MWKKSVRLLISIMRDLDQDQDRDWDPVQVQDWDPDQDQEQTRLESDPRTTESPLDRLDSGRLSDSCTCRTLKVWRIQI